MSVQMDLSEPVDITGKWRVHQLDQPAAAVSAEFTENKLLAVQMDV